MVLSQASLYLTMSSGLKSVQDLPVPAAEASADLIALKPRIARLDMTMERQAREISELRERSATAMWRWYMVNIIAGGECWAEWEERLTQVERSVTRMERAKEEDGRP